MIRRQILMISCTMAVLLSMSVGVFASQSVEELVQANIDRAFAYYQEGKFLEAANLIRKNQELKPNDPNLWKYEATIYDIWADEMVREEQHERSDMLYIYRQSLNAYDKSIQLAREWRYPSSFIAPLYVERAVILAKLGDLYGAFRELNVALSLDPENAYAYYRAGSISWFWAMTAASGVDMKKIAEARYYFAKAFRLGPEHLLPQVFLFYGLDAYARKDFEGAEIILTSWLNRFVYEMETKDYVPFWDRLWVNAGIEALKSLR